MMAPALIIGLCGFSEKCHWIFNKKRKKAKNSQNQMLTVVIQNKFVEISSARFLANILMHHFLSEFLECNGIRQWFAATLQCKWNIDITNRKALSIDCTNADAPIVWINTCQLWNISSHFTIDVAFAFPINILDVFGEIGKIRHNELMTECFGYQHNIRRNYTVANESSESRCFKMNFTIFFLLPI